MMKKYITLFCIVIASVAAMAQPDYPTAPPSPVNLTRLEYFIDTDPGFGNGTPVAISATQNLDGFSFDADLSGLSNGFHRIYLRSLDADGKWSLVNNTFFDNYIVPVYAVPSLAGNITEAEYFIDTDPGLGNATSFAFTPGAAINNQNIAVNITGLPGGAHRLYIRTKNMNGKWSLTNIAVFDNSAVPDYPAAPSPAGNITEIEYFIDADPGLGNGYKAVFGPAGNIADQNIAVNIAGLPAGVHQLYIRSKDENGKWSLTNFSLFDNSTTTPYPSAPPPAPLVGEMEYYIDTDPGFGNATPVTFTAGTDISNLSINIPLNSIAQGTHTLYIRSRQNPWSLSAYAEFLVGSTLPVSWLYAKGELKDETAIVSWATAMEENTKEFIVEHSIDGNDFKPLRQVPAAGNSNTSKTYSCTHAAPAKGFNYYRIKQVDIDGTFSYSKIITLFNAAAQKATVVGPNPVKDVLNIIEPKETLVRKMEIYDMNGRMMIRKNGETKNRIFSIPTGLLQKGNYLLKVFYKDSVKTFKIVKV
ncbi:MAG TPA: T9SS type A sorting domain-containing protein [Chitinophagaceae bacterium]|nr:T9SS type A sorting domain-containing protein [Chitinophagaceae bacterium]